MPIFILIGRTTAFSNRLEHLFFFQHKWLSHVIFESLEKILFKLILHILRERGRERAREKKER